MFWTTLLAHLIADFPLQTDRMVVAKKHLPGLTIHVTIHLAVMALLTFPILAITWPYILAITVLHFGIDAFKNLLNRKRPKWVTSSYLFDQFLHIVSLLMVSLWMAQGTTLPIWQTPSTWIAFAVGLLLSTYIWFVSERLMLYWNRTLQAQVNSTMWPRMGVRFLLYLLLVQFSLLNLLFALLTIIIIGILYGRRNYPRQWLLIDIGVAAISALIVHAIPVI